MNTILLLSLRKKLISYDKENKVIKIPVAIIDNDFQNGKVTDKFINYKFNGNYFLKQNK